VQKLGTRPLTLLPLIALPILLAWDAGAVTLMRMSVPDDADQAGRAGVMAIQFNNDATPEEAQSAFAAAKQVTDGHDETIDPASFTIYKDGSVTLKVSRSTPTVLFKFLPFFSGLTHTSTTTTVRRAAW
jgi:hypothetical protein